MHYPIQFNIYLFTYAKNKLLLYVSIVNVKISILDNAFEIITCKLIMFFLIVGRYPIATLLMIGDKQQCINYG